MKVASKIKKREYDKKYHNIPKVKERQKKYRKKNKEHIKLYKKEYWKKFGRKRRYNLTEEEFKELLINQGNRCKICNQYLDKKICVDHEHITNKIRGLLCHNCNIALGHFKDDVLILESANKYLKEVI